MTAQTMGEERVEQIVREEIARCTVLGPTRAEFLATSLIKRLASLPLTGEVAEKGVGRLRTALSRLVAVTENLTFEVGAIDGAAFGAAIMAAKQELLLEALTAQPAGVTEADDSDVAFLEEAARYFERRPTNGEDRAHWSNVYNAENCRRVASLLARPRQATPTWSEAIEAAAKCADAERDEAARYAASMTGLDARECEQARIDSARKIATAIRNLAPKAPE